MSFGPSNTQKTANNQLSGISGQATGQATNDVNTGTNLLNVGGKNVTSGTNYFDTLLNGNQANTSALLQPNIDQIRAANQNTIQSLSTLMPRGGGRSAALFNAAFQPNAQIQNLFNGVRGGAGSTLAQIGLGQQGLGTNLFNSANGALGAATGASGTLGNLAGQQRQQSNQEVAGIGQGLLGLATLPFGGGTAAGGLFGAIPGLGG